MGLTKPRVKSKKFQSFSLTESIESSPFLGSKCVRSIIISSVNELKNEIDDIFKDYMYCTNFILR